MTSTREAFERQQSLETPDEVIKLDPHRSTGGVGWGTMNTRVRDRQAVEQAMRPEAQPKTPIEQAGDYYFAIYKREQSEKKAREQAELLKQREREARERTEGERQRVIAEQIKFLCEQCGFSPEQAAARAHELNRRSL